MSLQVGEANLQVTAKLIFEANDEEVAKQAASVAQGLVALTKLDKEKPEAARLADALSLQQEGASVIAALAMPAADVINLLKTGAQKQAQKKAEKD